MLYLVTAGTDFIGHHMVEALLHRGHKIRVVDNLTLGRNQNLIAEPKEIEAGLENIGTAIVTNDVGTGVPNVVDQASLRPTSPLINLVENQQCGEIAMLEILTAAAQAGIRRVVFAETSTDSPPRRHSKATGARPLNHHPPSHLVGSTYISVFALFRSINTVTVRPFHVTHNGCFFR